ncbi:hypothetical protein CHUAL_002076 [Chamberlinius hualienensis]
MSFTQSTVESFAKQMSTISTMRLTTLAMLLEFIRSGQCELPKILMPQKMVETTESRIYLCTFNIPVDCLWQRKGATTNIFPYKYVNGTKIHTTDCSIIAKIEEPPIDYECIGILRYPKRVIVSDKSEAQIKCSTKENINCIWKKDGIPIKMNDDEYKFTYSHHGNDTHCLLTIMNLSVIDNSTWECDTANGNVIDVYYLKMPDPSGTESTTVETVTHNYDSTRKSNFHESTSTTFSISNYATNNNIDENTSSYSAYLNTIVSVATLFIVAAAITFYFYKKRKRRIKRRAKRKVSY